MRLYNRILCLLAALCLLAGVLSGCGKPQTEPPVQTEAVPETDGQAQTTELPEPELPELPAVTQQPGAEPEAEPETPQEPASSGKKNGKIGTMDGVQYDEKHGNLITPYTRCMISLEGESETFAYLDGEGDAFYTDVQSLATDFTETGAAVSQRFADGTELSTRFASCEDGTMDITQQIENAGNGISALRFKVTVPMKYDVIIPAWNGIRLTAEHPEIYDKRTTITYPREWQAQMVLVQGANGGMLIQARDDGTQFKALNITNDGENFYLEFCTVPQAPFTGYTEFETVCWSVIPYEGGWMNGALLYKQYMEDTFALSELNAREPEWASEIQLVWMDDLDSKDKLALLAQEVNPEQTLIQIPGWRAADYDTEYPDYTPKEGIVDLIAYAKSLGFKISLHCNMLGCAFDSQEWQNGISEVACKDAYTLETIVEGYTAFGKDYRFGQINQAAVEWQDLMVERMTELVEATGADCIHLDQSLLCFNDGNGYVNGMTTMQGNVELQRKLAEALPGVAFSGEGINEFNMRYADFLQQHVYGLDSVGQTWENAYFDQILPLVTVLFNDYARCYHYPALPTADEKNRDAYLAWYRSGNVQAALIPCLYRESVVSLTEPSEVFTMMLDEARFYMENKPVLNLTQWDDGVLMSYVLRDGTIAEWRRTDEDICFYPDVSAEEPEKVFVYGTDTYKTDRTLAGWVMYNEDAITGLRAEDAYLLSNVSRDDNATHITAIEENLTLRSFYSDAQYTAVAMEEIVPSNKRVVSFTDYGGTMRGGEVLYDGGHNETMEFNSLQSFWFTLPQQGQVRHLGDRIMFHPPWVDEVQAIGYTWLEVDVPLEVLGNASFNASFQLATAESAAGSDGVIFRVYAWAADDAEKANMVSQEVMCLTEIGIPVSLDLTPFEGKTVKVRIECYTGETPRNDSCHMVSPQIVQDKGKVERQISFDVKTRDPVTGVISETGNAVCEGGENNTYTVTCDINDTVWLLHNPAAVRNNEDMTVYPFTAYWLLGTGEAASPEKGMFPEQMVAESCYELRNGIFQHPPQNGVSRLSWLLTLPEGDGLRFEAAPAMRKGSVQSDGVTFSVLVNGKEVFRQLKEGAEGYTDISVDLNDYAGQTVVLTLQTDSGETSAYDLAFWGDPVIYTK